MDKSYRELISESAEAQEREAIDFSVEEAKQQIDLDILETKKGLSDAKRRLASAERETGDDFSPTEIIKIEVEVEGYTQGLEKLEALKKRLFPENE